MQPAPASPSLRAVEERQLVAQMARGDEGALARLYERYASLLLALAIRVVGDPAEGEEVVQEAFLQAWRQAERYVPERSSVSTWLVMMTRSRAIDRIRSRNVKERALAAAQREETRTHESPSGARNVLQGERSKRLRRELAELPAEQRQVLELAFFSGLTQREIAAETGIPLGTVKTRTLLAMKKLRSALEKDLGDLL
ncbi:MAG: sigma-70 family RNA polymerase sigma factor [Acidobacteriota bacterium]|nr:sigma-70 family RNA polymerase sigma factor [Acidobacteriota bacterium]MDH3522547.1 sigma-70 family RNA polymerase sigma factor [Acidobacteriota bacterium]